MAAREYLRAKLCWPNQDIAQVVANPFRAQCLVAHGLVSVERIHDGAQQ
jgi:hypothetical protein